MGSTGQDGTQGATVMEKGGKESSLGNEFRRLYERIRVHLAPAANGSTPAQAAEPKPGDRMPDGTIFAGISPDTNKPMYTTPADAPLTMRWKEAMKYAANLEAYGHQDWRVPSKAELNTLFNNRAAIGGFNATGSDPAGWYWSSTEGNNGCGWAQRFNDGNHGWDDKNFDSSLRCVR